MKLVEPNGYEQIWEIKKFWAYPVTEENQRTVYAISDDGEEISCSAYGTVYVMNGAGKTVGTYVLGYRSGADMVAEELGTVAPKGEPAPMIIDRLLAPANAESVERFRQAAGMSHEDIERINKAAADVGIGSEAAPA